MTVEPGIEYQIRGGADPATAAAVVAAVLQIMTEQAAAAAQPPARPEQGSWVAAGRPRRPGPAIRNDLQQSLPGWSIAVED